jgi:hypothetical protein
MKKSEKLGTIHDAKNEILDFFQNIDKDRIDLEEVKILKQKLKSLKEFNEIIENKRIELEDYVKGGLNVKNNMAILKNDKKIELEIPKKLRTILSNDFQQLKLKEFYLRPIDEFKYKNYINFYSGKKFDFILDTGFSKHKIKFDDLKKDVVLTEKNFVKKLISKYKEDIDAAYEKDKKTKNKQEFKKIEKVYEKIYKVIQHNENITSEKEYTKPLFERNEEGDYVRSGGEYPMMFELLDFIMNIYIS